MKIGIDARLWNESGVGRYTRNLVNELAKIDIKNEYVLFGGTEIQNSKFKDQNHNSKFKNNQWRIVETNIRWHTIEEQLKFPQILNKENLDLVHFPYFSVPLFYNKPFVVTIHDLILHHFPTGQASTLPSLFYWIKLFGYKFVIVQAAKRAKKVITVSQATKDEIIDHLGINQEKVTVTYEGVDTEISNFKSQISNKSTNTKYKIPNTKYFLYVGNAYPHKNLERLIEAFQIYCHPELVSGSDSGSWTRMTRGIPNSVRKAQDFASTQQVRNDTNLVIVGKDDFFYKRLREKVKQMGLEDSIIFYGEVTDQELIGLYKNAKALIAPSLMEGFGLPVLEAMSNKCLVLASDIPVHREIAGDSAIYFDPQSISDLTDKLKVIHSNDIYHYSENIQMGIERAGKFSWQKMAKQTLQIYQEVARSK